MKQPGNNTKLPIYLFNARCYLLAPSRHIENKLIRGQTKGYYVHRNAVLKGV